MTDRPIAQFATLLALATASLASGAHAQNTEPRDACAASFSPPVLAKWATLGGSRGFGCPIAPEMAAPASPQGSQAREATFRAAAILWHATGPRAGQTYSVSGCAYRLYFQHGGPAGWLGLPTSDPINTPDGQKQMFEGGVITFQRALETCDAEAPETAVTQAASARAPLDQFHDASRDDDLAAASATTVDRALAANYQRVRTEGYVFTEPGSDLIPLKVYWNETLGAHTDVATSESEREALAAGYEFDGAQGYIYADPHPGTKALKLFRHPENGRVLLAATPETEADAAARGFVFVRIEGYVATSR
jgi:hypothetical protein